MGRAESVNGWCHQCVGDCTWAGPRVSARVENQRTLPGCSVFWVQDRWASDQSRTESITSPGNVADRRLATARHRGRSRSPSCSASRGPGAGTGLAVWAGGMHAAISIRPDPDLLLGLTLWRSYAQAGGENRILTGLGTYTCRMTGRNSLRRLSVPYVPNWWIPLGATSSRSCGFAGVTSCRPATGSQRPRMSIRSVSRQARACPHSSPVVSHI